MARNQRSESDLARDRFGHSQNCIKLWIQAFRIEADNSGTSGLFGCFWLETPRSKACSFECAREGLNQAPFRSLFGTELEFSIVNPYKWAWALVMLTQKHIEKHMLCLYSGPCCGFSRIHSQIQTPTLESMNRLLQGSIFRGHIFRCVAFDNFISHLF